MKKVTALFTALLIVSAVFASRATEPFKESSIAFIKSGSVVKVIYSSERQASTRITITDLRGKEVFTETVRSCHGFSRPYNLSQLSGSNYVVKVSDGKESRSTLVTLPSQRKAVNKVTELDAETEKYSLLIRLSKLIYLPAKILSDDFQTFARFPCEAVLKV
ncbi:MAG: hypothetical protein KF687_07325 [Cyclobacteriaceae bacterium]|nr:hypothetical protein [Cyclobacteriaceae bacterium]